MMETAVSDLQGASVLDLGSGTGDLLRRFSTLGAARLVGLDASPGMLAEAAGLSECYESISYVQGSPEELPFEDSEFDIVTSCIAFHHFPDARRSLVEALRVLRPGGRIYVCDLTSRGLQGKAMLCFGRYFRADELYHTEDSLSEMMKDAGFEDVSVRRPRVLVPTMLLSARKPV